MKSIRFLMIGGFLGAGKTTAIARVARHYTNLGQKVGIVTNDQAYDLVDTHSLRAQGFDVGEVPGACFCCKFDDLVDTVKHLSTQQQPDLILAEPVGSCTDLVATVIEPLRQLYGDSYLISPLAVLLKPEHGRKILQQQAGGGFSPKAQYIFLKQVEEADVIAVNKADKMSNAQRTELLELLEQRFPGKEHYLVSAKTGEGFDELIAAMERAATVHGSFIEVDYDTYAEGEAELGWLNCQVRFQSATDDEPASDTNGPRQGTAEHATGEGLPSAQLASFQLDQLVVELLTDIRQRLSKSNAETAHLKILGHGSVTGDEVNDQTAIANLVDSEGAVELSVASELAVKTADLILNARVATSPDLLEQVVRESVDNIASVRGLAAEVTGMQRFRPGRPVPTHRMA